MREQLTKTVKRVVTVDVPNPLVIDEVYTGEDMYDYVSALIGSGADRVWFKRHDGVAWRYSYVKVDDFRRLLSDHAILWPLGYTRARKVQFVFYCMESGSGVNIKRLPWWSD